MPVMLPPIDDRRFDALRTEALELAAAHVPEWTNFNRSDPGVTLVEVFAFLAENLLYRANQIPERNRRKFLQLLRIPLQSATAAQSLITVANPTAAPVVIGDGFEVRAGQLPFRTTRGLDILPVEGRLFVKRLIADPAPEAKAYYEQLYASFRGTPPVAATRLYEAVPFPLRSGRPIALGETIDHGFWLALLAPTEAAVDATRNALGGRTLTLGVVPSLADSTAVLPEGRAFGVTPTVKLQVFAPQVDASGLLPDNPADRVAKWIEIPSRSETDVLSVPGVVDVTLPGADGLRLWQNIEPLEAGVGALPPAIEDERVARRVVTWLRILSTAHPSAGFLWMGINAAPVTQLTRVASELLPVGSGEPDQIARLARPPVQPRSVRLLVTSDGGTAEWSEIDDLMAAGPEVPVPDLRKPPGAQARREAPSNVFLLDAEAGELRFGDGIHGARLPAGATVRATYDTSAGAAGNVGADAITKASALPDSFKITNPIAAWGGANAESVADGEKQITRYLQHRDRLVTAADFATIALRTPGVDIGRVEVLPNFHPDGGDGAGVVTLMVVPAIDAEQPDAPLPRAPFLEAICRYLDPRRLITTQVFLRGPRYKDILVSIGITAAPNRNESQVAEDVKAAVVRFLAPTAGGRQRLPDDPAAVLAAASSDANGWQLGKAVHAAEIAAVVNRTAGVQFANGVLVAESDGTGEPVRMVGLELPRIRAIRVAIGSPASIAELQDGTPPPVVVDPNLPSVSPLTDPAAAAAADSGTPFVQVPVIPEECR